MIPKFVSNLVELFDRNFEEVHQLGYKEASLCATYLKPLFGLRSLGWDFANEKGVAEAYREVLPQASLQVEGKHRAPDYVFRAGKEKKFFVEAKVPRVKIKDDKEAAFQLKRYAWTAELGVSILTNFKEFAIYQCRSVPKHTDSAAKDRVDYFTIDELEERWPFLAATFSRDAIWQGAFDKYALSTAGKRGTTPFDTQFLKDLLDWRKILARNIALRNPKLTEHQLNVAVQLTLDRIILLRVCEDRGIEDYGKLALQAGYADSSGLKRKHGQEIYKGLLQYFNYADDRYNSGLFHFRRERGRDEFDSITPKLQIDDEILDRILRELYYPSPYAFREVRSDILGSIYEQFLEHFISLDSKHQANIEQKPQYKKQGGVFYTPPFVVHYIVKQTLGKALHNKTPKDIQNFRILDPSCGSGSFLLEAFQFLLDWYRDYYLENDPDKWADADVPELKYEKIQREAEERKQRELGRTVKRRKRSKILVKYERVSGVGLALSTAARRWILLTHIYGVDIDRQAVEVSKLNLLLKVLEDSNEEHRLAYEARERLLPDLGNNLVCGNSLVSSNFFQHELDLDQAEKEDVNAMNWEDVFPDIMTHGFDVVIGNPPYGAQLQTGVKEYFSD